MAAVALIISKSSTGFGIRVLDSPGFYFFSNTLPFFFIKDLLSAVQYPVLCFAKDSTLTSLYEFSCSRCSSFIWSTTCKKWCMNDVYQSIWYAISCLLFSRWTILLCLHNYLYQASLRFRRTLFYFKLSCNKTAVRATLREVYTKGGHTRGGLPQGNGL